RFARMRQKEARVGKTDFQSPETHAFAHGTDGCADDGSPSPAIARVARADVESVAGNPGRHGTVAGGQWRNGSAGVLACGLGRRPAARRSCWHRDGANTRS